jgi:hypothetical protein
LTDANGRLQRDAESVGHYCIHPRGDGNGKLLHDLMTEKNLSAASTYFKPKRGKRKLGNATYVMAKTEDSKQPPAQIDYILVSKRWMSSVLDCKVEWSHAISRHGYRTDHGLIAMTFKQKIAVPTKASKKPDFSAFDDEDTKIKYENDVSKHAADFSMPASKSETDEILKKLQYAVKEAIEDLPVLKVKKGVKRNSSHETEEIFEQRARELQKLTSTGIRRKSYLWVWTKNKFRSDIFKACRDDYRNYVYGILDEIEADINKNDYKAVFKGVKKLTGKKYSSKAPTKDINGKLFASAEELCNAWMEFAAEKFAATEKERERGELPPLGDPSLRAHEKLTDDELDLCLNALAKSKAVGEDGIPVEAYRSSATARALLFELIRVIWRSEKVPKDLVRGIFLPIFKNKGSIDDMSKYRFICLLNHAYKVLSAVILLKMQKETEEFLPETQAGFRAKRSTCDNIYVLAKLIDITIGEDAELIATFIDFVAAFDTVSHFFLDEALGVANVSAKCRAILREIYEAATAVVTVKQADGTTVMSEEVNVGRGVLQGDIISPKCFTVALHLIRIMHDIRGGIEVEGFNIDCLEYADDAALLDKVIEQATERITALEEGALKSADMVISRPKTEVMQIRRQEKTAPLTYEKVEELIEEGVLKHKCKDCGAGFHKKWGLAMHVNRWCGEAQREVYEKDHEIEKLLDVRGAPQRRFFRIKWKGYPLNEIEKLNWEPIRHLIGTAEVEMENFWASRPDLNIESKIEVINEVRCCYCNQFFKTMPALKGHHTKSPEKGGCKCKPQSIASGTNTAKVAARRELVLKQSERKHVFAGDHELKNVFDFVYLGHNFQADGQGEYAIEKRKEKAQRTFGRLHEFWACKVLPLKAKLRMYQCCVWSTVTYGNKAWKLTDATCSSLRNWNAKNLYRITNREIYDETKTPTLDLIKFLWAQRLKWVGHVLRRGQEFPARRMLMMEQKPYEEGSILQDKTIPKHGSMEELAELAEDRENWNKMVNAIKYNEDTKHTLNATRGANPIPKSNIVTRSRKREGGARADAMRGTENP